jgi:hypothetical protein
VPGNLHPIEAAWRRFRAGPLHELLTRSLELSQSCLDFIGLKHPPNEIVLPGTVAWGLVMQDAERPLYGTAGFWNIDDDAILVNTVHVWAAYRESKTIYEIEPALAECLARSEWPETTPLAALRLPSRCPVLSIPRGDTTTHLAATYDLVPEDEKSGALELRISHFGEDWWIPISILHLTRENLRECAEAAAAKARPHGGLDEAAWLRQNATAGLVLTLLLYLGGDPDVVRIVHPGARLAVKPKLERTDPGRFRDLREPVIHAVGKSFARAIERWEIEHAGERGVASGRTMRPHLRRAHAHLYWTGKGRELPRVRFLLPISVSGGKLIEEPGHPRETTVR